MPFAVVLDASVLYPLPLRDTLLRIAETELYDAYWSSRILDEVARNLIADGRATEHQARRLITTMNEAFDGDAVPQEAVDRLESAMTNDAKDRHVLAAAVASDAQAIVTLNLKTSRSTHASHSRSSRSILTPSSSTSTTSTPTRSSQPSSAKPQRCDTHR